MARYIRGTQNHLEISPAADVAAGECVPAAECPDVVAVYTRPYSAGDKGAAAYTGVFEFYTELGATPVGTAVDIDVAADDLGTNQGEAIAASTGVGGVLVRKIETGDTVALVAINVTSKTA